MWGGTVLRGHGGSAPLNPSTPLCPMYLLHSTVPEFYPFILSINNNQKVSKGLSWVLWLVLVRYWKLKVGSQSPQIYSQLVRSMCDPGTCSCHLKWWLSDGVEPSAAGVGINSADLVSEVSWLGGRPVGVGELVGVGRDTTYLVSGKKSRLIHPWALVAGMRLRYRGVKVGGSAPRNSYQLSIF